MPTAHRNLPRLSTQQIARFWNKVICRPSGCWEWQGAKSQPNYYGVWRPTGFFRLYAHRLSYFLYYQRDPRGLCVCHSCDNRLCVNPLHLFLGTHQDNHDDMMRKNRQVKGQSVPQAKLSKADVLEIREQYQSRKCGHSLYALAGKYKVAPATIWRIINGVTWKHV